MRHTFFCIDAHACGNPVRLVAAGAPQLPHLSMAERRDIFVRDHDWVRRALMFEPRGHDIMSGAILYPSVRADCDVGVLFIEVSGCLPMCGAGTIGLVTIAIEEGLVVPRVPGQLALETPAGRVDVRYEQTGSKVDSVQIFNVASFLSHLGVEVEVPGLGRITVDVAYGGNYYAIIEPQANWPGLAGMSSAHLVEHSQAVRRALVDLPGVVHPDDARIAGVHHVLWCGAADAGCDGRLAVFYGDKGIDRSPGGTGTSARLAQLHGRARLASGQTWRAQSLIGTVYEGCVESTTQVGPYPAVVPSVRGWAQVIGHNTIFVDDADPLAHGFQLP